MTTTSSGPVAAALISRISRSARAFNLFHNFGFDCSHRSIDAIERNSNGFTVIDAMAHATSTL